MRARLVLAPGKDKAVLRRHPWIFSGAVLRHEGTPQDGDLVDVYAADGRWLAVGHYQHDSIICKVLSFDTPELGDTFFEQRILSAVRYREQLGFFARNDTNVFRLVHAEGDALPGLVCDWYNGLLVMQAHSVGMHRLFPLLTQLFVRHLSQYHIRAVYDKSAATLPGGCDDGYLWGEGQEVWEVQENGVLLLVNPREGQKTGFFVDQRENRRLVSQLSHGHRVLNCFGYTGGFSLAALQGGAEYVETVDISKRAIELCNSNVALNAGLASDRHQGVVADVLQYLATPHVREAQFDFIVLDPPAFAKSHRHLEQGLKGYRKINQAAMEAIAPGGLLMTFSCSQAVSNEDFQAMVFTSAIQSRCQVRIVRRLPHAMDHPVSIYHPEGEYLKGLLLQIEK